MKKIIVLIISIFMLTACSVKYNVIIDSDLTIKEEAVFTGTDDFFANYYKTTKKNVLKSLLEEYESILKENDYKYDFIVEDKPYVNVEKKYESIQEYIDNSLLFNDYFDEIKYTENGNIKKIETIGFNQNNSDDPNRFDIKELQITITCPYKVKNHNAVNIDKATNTYYYELSDKTNYKILLEFDASKKYNPHESAILGIIIGLITILVGWIIIYMLNKKKNK